MLIRDILDLYLRDRAPLVRNPVAMRNNARVVASYFGDYTPEDLFAQAIVQGYANQRTSGDRRVKKSKVSLSSVRRELGVLQAAMNHARKTRAYPRDVPTLWRPPESAPRRQWLTRSQVAAMLQDLAARSRRFPNNPTLRRGIIFLLVSVFTGGREAAVRELTWDRVHMPEGGLGNGYIDFRDPNVPVTKKRRAVVPISDELLPYLKRFRDEATTPYVCGDPGTVRGTLKGSAKRCGVKDFHVHCLRRSFATWAAQDSVDIVMIAEALGDTVERTMSSYAVFHPDYMSKLTRRTTLGGDLLGEDQ